MELNGFFRGKVMTNEDLQMGGRIGVVIPYLMPGVSMNESEAVNIKTN